MARRLADQPHAPAPTRERTVATVPGCRPLTPQTARAAVVDHWGRSQALTDQTLTRMGETVNRFALHLQAQGVAHLEDVRPPHAAAFVMAATTKGSEPELATQHARRTAIRTFYRTLRQLDLAIGDPTLDLDLPPRGVLVARPLTYDEVALGRVSVLTGSGVRIAGIRAVAWALGEATAVTSEITAVQINDLDDPTQPTLVKLPGTWRHDARLGQLSSWGSLVVAARAQSLLSTGAHPTTLLAYGGAAPAGGPKAQASVCNALRDVLDAAGLAAECDVRPSSLRHWAGRSAYDAGNPIEAVARMLGHRSLDASAEDIGLDWRTAPSTGRPVQR